MLQFLLTICDEKYHEQIEFLYNTYHEDMVRFATSKFRLRHRNNPLLDAEDAVQSCFLRISKYIEKVKFTDNQKQLKNYIFTILVHEIGRVIESNYENFDCLEEVVDESSCDFIEQLNIKEQYNEVVKAIERLDEIYSTTLFLAYCQEMTVNEIAELMDVSPKTVYTRLARGKQILRNSLKGE